MNFKNSIQPLTTKQYENIYFNTSYYTCNFRLNFSNRFGIWPNEIINLSTFKIKIMNTYSKFAANVFVAKCPVMHEKGELIELTTKYGSTHDCIVFNLVGRDREGNFYYSIVRADGYNVQERAKAKAERYQNWAAAAESKSTAYYNASQEGRDFLSLGEPIKVGHHSEKRHRALIDRNWNRIGKSVEASEKAAEHESKADYWAKKANDINLSMPESVELWEYKLEEAKEKHQMYKDFPEKREHSFSLTYAKKAVNEAEKNLLTAKKLWE